MVANFLQSVRSRLRERHTVRAHFWQSLANYTQQGFGLFFGVILARLLTPADFGAFGFAVAVVFLSLLPAMWSLAPTLISEGGQTPANHALAAGFGWCVVFVRMAIIAGLGCYYFTSGKHQTAALCLLVGIAESGRELNNVQRAYSEGQGNFKPNLVSAIAGIVFCLGVVVPVCLLGWGPFTLTLPGIGSQLMDFFIYRHYSGRTVFVKPKWSQGSDIVKKGFWLWLYAACENALMRLDSWFVGRFRGETALGYYNRAFGYAPLSNMFLSSLVTNPTVVGFARCETGTARRRLFIRTACILLAGGFVNWVVFFFFAHPIILFVFGPKWEGAVPIFEAFAGLSLAYAIALLPTTAMLAV
jgi:O-antigen/teichoic acid export membrane protein